jgi:hypothetical protein
MATIIDVAHDAASHVAQCESAEPVQIEAPSRVCWCDDGDTSQLDELLDAAPPERTMRKVRRSCAHATVVTHTCRLCGYSRSYGGPRF